MGLGGVVVVVVVDGWGTVDGWRLCRCYGWTQPS